MLKRFKKPEFLYLAGIILLTAIVAVGFGISKSSEQVQTSQGNVFDESQYLFSEPNKLLSIASINVIEGSILEPFSPPFLIEGKALGSMTSFAPKQEIEEYLVESGDTLSSVAAKFDISLSTVLWANNLTTSSVIQPGKKLVILPVTGAMHVVGPGDTISEIAELYKAKADDIIEFNGLTEEGDIFGGDILVIPNGTKPRYSQTYVQVPLSKSYFICPVPSPCKITQGLHWYNAVDFSNGKCGDPVYAAAGGTVQRTGYGNVGGRYVRIMHANGVVTYYGHLSKYIVSPGQKVYQGQIVGYVGYSGVTVPRGPAGCHLHFDVRFAKNPFSVYRTGTQLGK